jgi:SAM-dependent methyltransferase
MLTAAQFQRKTRTVLARTFYFVRTGYIQTGERVNPDFPYVNFENHLKVYRFLAQFAKGNDILDIGCGLGYGTDYLRPFARSIVGIDISKPAIGFARHRYPETQFFLMDAEALPKTLNISQIRKRVSERSLAYLPPEGCVFLLHPTVKSPGSGTLTTPTNSRGQSWPNCFRVSSSTWKCGRASCGRRIGRASGCLRRI